MKNILKTFILVCIPLMFFGLVAMAQGDQKIPNEQYLIDLFKSIGGLKGASTMVIVATIVQLIVKALKTEYLGKIFDSWSGLGKLIVVSALTIISGVTSLMAFSGLSFGASVVHSSTVGAFMVLINQFIQQGKKL